MIVKKMSMTIFNKLITLTNQYEILGTKIHYFAKIIYIVLI